MFSPQQKIAAISNSTSWCTIHFKSYVIPSPILDIVIARDAEITLLVNRRFRLVITARKDIIRNPKKFSPSGVFFTPALFCGYHPIHYFLSYICFLFGGWWPVISVTRSQEPFWSYSESEAMHLTWAALSMSADIFSIQNLLFACEDWHRNNPC